MLFERKQWADRAVEYPNRRVLRDVDGAAERGCFIERDEGQVFVQGDRFDAETMNGLEYRIEQGFAALRQLVLEAEAGGAAVQATVGEKPAALEARLARLEAAVAALGGEAVDGV